MMQLDETFSIEDGVLIRSVIPKRGTPYVHTCTLDVYKDIAWAINELGGRSFTGDALRDAADAPHTQAFVALAFLKERGCVVQVHGRRHAAASGTVYEDAMIEWHALRENAGA